jgi:hypothetical protein
MKFAYFAAAAVVVIAQAASAQLVKDVGITIKPVSWMNTAEKIPTMSAGRDSYVSATNGFGYFISNTAKPVITVGGKRVIHLEVKPGMNCIVNAAVNPSLSNRYYITTLAC